MTKFNEFPLDDIAVAQLKQLSEVLIPAPEQSVGQRAKALLKTLFKLNRKFEAKQDSESMKLHYERIWRSFSKT